jgi:predicted acyl esterase
MLGQWGHSYPDDAGSRADNPNMRWDWAQILLRWFDYWLRDNTTIDLGPPVQVLDAEGQWRVEAAYPPRDAAWTTFHLAGGEALANESGNAGDVLLTAQAVAAAPEGVPEPPATPGRSADFLTPPMARDTRISGLPRVHVTVTPEGPTGHVAAWLYEVAPDGSERAIGWTMMNLRFADGTYEPNDLSPGEPVVARMEIQPMEAVVAEGNQLMLRIWQYRDDPPGDTAQGRLPSVAPLPITLNFGGDRHSVLELPIVERGPEAFFVPPRP